MLTLCNKDFRSTDAMTTYYRGAGVDTYWHSRDARASGFSAQMPGAAGGRQTIINHINNQLTSTSPYISMTRSYEVAEHYARYFGRDHPSPARPAFVYEVEFDPMPAGLQLLDPIIEIAKTLNSPLAPPPFYQHNGAPDVLLAVVRESVLPNILRTPVRNPGVPAGNLPHISDNLRALVRALRDAEVLAYVAIPQNCVRQRYAIE